MEVRLMYLASGSLVGAFTSDAKVENELNKRWPLAELEGIRVKNLYGLKHKGKLVAVVITGTGPDDGEEFIPILDPDFNKLKIPFEQRAITVD